MTDRVIIMIIEITDIEVKVPSLQESNHLDIYKHDPGIEICVTDHKCSLLGNGSGLEFSISELQR